MVAISLHEVKTKFSNSKGQTNKCAVLGGNRAVLGYKRAGGDGRHLFRWSFASQAGFPPCGSVAQVKAYDRARNGRLAYKNRKGEGRLPLHLSTTGNITRLL